MSPRFESFRAYALPFVSGALTVFAFPPFSFAPLAFVGLVPLLLWLSGPLGRRELHRGGWAFALPYIGGNLYWFYELGRVTVVGIAGATAVLLLFWATFFVFPIVVNVLNHTIRLPLVVAAPCVWVVSECARGYGDMAFPAVTLGYALSAWPKLIQHADLVGVYGVSFWIVLINALIAAMLASRGNTRRLTVHAVALAAAVGLPAAYNTMRWRQVEREIAAAPTMTVALLQPNVEQRLKWDIASVDMIYDRVNRMIHEAEAGGPDLVIGPEACFPLVQSVDAVRLPDEILAGTRPLLIGAVTGIGRGEVRPLRARTQTIYTQHYNSAVLAGPDRAVLGRHDKQYLVPVSEQIPEKAVFGFFLPFMKKQFGRFVPGATLGLLHVTVGGTDVPFGTLICYESVFPSLGRRLHRMGAAFLVNISNDAWFGQTSFPFQHVGFCAFRAIENRCAVVRSANTGVSGVYDPLGRPGGLTPIFQEATVTAKIPLMRASTVYGRVGDVAMYGSFAATAVFLLLALRHHRK